MQITVEVDEEAGNIERAKLASGKDVIVITQDAGWPYYLGGKHDGPRLGLPPL